MSNDANVSWVTPCDQVTDSTKLLCPSSVDSHWLVARSQILIVPLYYADVSGVASCDQAIDLSNMVASCDQATEIYLELLLAHHGPLGLAPPGGINIHPSNPPCPLLQLAYQ